MTSDFLVKIAATAPLAFGGLLVLFNPLYDRFIEFGANREFSAALYLAEDEKHTPVPLIMRYTSWALDVAQAGPLILGPLVGLVAALSGEKNKDFGWLYAVFVFVGIGIFLYTASVKRPVLYGARKYGARRNGKLLFGWTKVSIATMVIYLGASVAVYFSF